MPFWTPKPLKRTPQDTQIFLCGISKNPNLKLIIEFFHLLIIPMTLFNNIMPYFNEFIHVYGWNMSILWSHLKIWMPKNFTTANFRHPVSKSWLRPWLAGIQVYHTLFLGSLSGKTFKKMLNWEAASLSNWQEKYWNKTSVNELLLYKLSPFCYFARSSAGMQLILLFISRLRKTSEMWTSSLTMRVLLPVRSSWTAQISLFRRQWKSTLWHIFG